MTRTLTGGTGSVTTTTYSTTVRYLTWPAVGDTVPSLQGVPWPAAAAGSAVTGGAGVRAGQAGVAGGGQLGGGGARHHAGGDVKLVVWVAGAAVLVLGPHTGLAAIMTGQAGPLARVHAWLAHSALRWQAQLLRCFYPALATHSAHSSTCLALITPCRTGQALPPGTVASVPRWTVRDTPPLKVEPLLAASTLGISSSYTGLTALMTGLAPPSIMVFTLLTPSLARTTATQYQGWLT